MHSKAYRDKHVLKIYFILQYHETMSLKIFESLRSFDCFLKGSDSVLGLNVIYNIILCKMLLLPELEKDKVELFWEITSPTSPSRRHIGITFVSGVVVVDGVRISLSGA